ncbi:hypothetical protein B0H14DRAFT_2991898 [Mycena olivaceomarginata]|nr:hypothetical protein B0H14DRAFT_2991898 [Mycena olivaceomarginata]
MMCIGLSNWAVQRCVEATTGPEERRKIVACMRYICHLPPPYLFPHGGRIVDLAPNCCGYRVLQKALDCKEEEVCLLTGSELLRVDPATTLVNKHASHVSNKTTELSWTPPAPPILTYPTRASTPRLHAVRYAIPLTSSSCSC